MLLVLLTLLLAGLLSAALTRLRLLISLLLLLLTLLTALGLLVLLLLLLLALALTLTLLLLVGLVLPVLLTPNLLRLLIALTLLLTTTLLRLLVLLIRLLPALLALLVRSLSLALLTVLRLLILPLSLTLLTGLGLLALSPLLTLLALLALLTRLILLRLLSTLTRLSLLLLLVAGLLIGLGFVPRNLVIQLARQVIKFAAGAAQCLGVIPEDAFGRALDALLQIADVVAGHLLEGRGFPEEIPVGQLAGRFQGLLGIALTVLAEGVVKLAREQRFDVFGSLAHAAHLAEQVGEADLLLRELIGESLDLIGIA